MITTAFTELVGCQVPIQQAPMGGISPPELAVAVSRAGALGTITAPPGATTEDLLPQLDYLTEQNPGALAVNFITDKIDHDTVRLAAGRVAVIDFFWSTPRADIVDLVHEAGAVVNWQVGSVADAKAAADAGADLVTAQGMEAGGHVRGDTALLPLLTSVLDEVTVPVLAAGGIAHPRALAAVLAAGAAAARIGTRFIASEESGAHPDYVSAILRAGPDSTQITDGFAVCPLCATLPRARVLTSAVDAVAALEGDSTGTMLTGEGEVDLPKRFGMSPHHGIRGRIDAMALYAGQSVGAVTEVQPAADIVSHLAEQAEALLRAW